MIYRSTLGESSVFGLLLFGKRLMIGFVRTKDCRGFYVQWARRAWRVMPGYLVTP